ncbi:putative DMT superfamily transporter inner membrane protein [Halalkalicoccus paucihalophilus]|uniref:Putative DMT superfamily transporter inner membrane protein n=1 Tax=Halalkalicoccus paucihalophilus TaxID=1008153 RepID=A0A151AAU3_9EURY|nr:DMT family transporter [Halalkalicoccus paucihalophilus]KYH24670.1 putative DMT superfamily transporter inner membrane protein [Halalkalicoccus paucihalophilus]
MNAESGQTKAKSGRRTLLLFIITSLAFGTAFVGIKAGLDDIPPILFAGFRYDIGAVVLLTYVYWRGGYWQPRTRGDLIAVVVAGIFLSGLSATLLFLGQQYLTTGTAAVIFSLVPVLAPLFALVLLPEERFGLVELVGILLGLVGVVIIVGLNSLSNFGNSTVRGVALVGGAAVAIAFGSVLLSRTDRSISGLGMTAWALLLAAGLVHSFSLLMGESPEDITPTIGALIAVLWVGLPATALAFPSYYGLIDRAGPVRANLISYTVPLVATSVGAIALGEVISVRTIFGFVVIVIGFALIERQNIWCEILRLRGLPAPPEQDDEHICECAPRG